MKKLCAIQRPFIILVVAESTPSNCIRQIELGEQLSVDGFEINLAPLRNRKIGDIFASTNKPCIVSNRRPEFMKLYGYENLPRASERERVQKLLQAMNCGARVVDYELDTFVEDDARFDIPFGSRGETTYARNPRSTPTQLSMNLQAAIRQRKLSQKIKSVGGEVLISCHTQTQIRKSETLAILRTMARRGADLGKIVVHTFDPTDLADFLSTTIELKKSGLIPFNLMNFGEYAKLGRLLSVLFGSAWIYCRTSSRKSFVGQPTVSEAREFLEKYCSP